MKKTLLLSLAAATTLAAAAPALAQPGYGGWQPINARQDRLYERIERGVANGSLTRPEARRLRNEFQGIIRLEARYRQGGLNGWERSDLDRRMDLLSQRIRYERNDHQDRGDRHGYRR